LRRVYHKNTVSLRITPFFFNVAAICAGALPDSIVTTTLLVASLFTAANCDEYQSHPPATTRRTSPAKLTALHTIRFFQPFLGGFGAGAGVSSIDWCVI